MRIESNLTTTVALDAGHASPAPRASADASGSSSFTRAARSPLPAGVTQPHAFALGEAGQSPSPTTRAVQDLIRREKIDGDPADATGRYILLAVESRNHVLVVVREPGMPASGSSTHRAFEGKPGEPLKPVTGDLVVDQDRCGGAVSVLRNGKPLFIGESGGCSGGAAGLRGEPFKKVPGIDTFFGSI